MKQITLKRMSKMTWRKTDYEIFEKEKEFNLHSVQV